MSLTRNLPLARKVFSQLAMLCCKHETVRPSVWSIFCLHNSFDVWKRESSWPNLDSSNQYDVGSDSTRVAKPPLHLPNVSNLLRWTERKLFTSFFSPADFAMSRGYWSRMPGHFSLLQPSWPDWHTWPQSHAAWQRKFRLSQAALLWISKVRGYDHICSGWSAKEKKKRKSQL